MKDKELRETLYNSCKEFDEKLNFIYKQLQQLERYGAIDMPHFVFMDPKNPFDMQEYFVSLSPNWRDLEKKKK